MDEPEPAPAEASDELVARLARASAERPDGVDRYTPPPSGFDPGWITIGVGICIAGAVYPSLVTLIVVVIGGASAFASGDLPTDIDLLEVLIAAGSAMILGGVGILCLTTVVCLPVLLAAKAILRLLRIRAEWTTIGASCGGTVAFALWSPTCYHVSHWTLADLQKGNWPPSLQLPLLTLMIGPLLAFMAGQVGGAYGGLVLERAGISHHSVDSRRRPTRLSFSIGQLFSLTLIVSVVFAALRMAGLLNAAMLLALACWLGLQVALRRPAIWIAERVMRFLRRPKPRGYLIASGKPADSEGAVR